MFKVSGSPTKSTKKIWLLLSLTFLVVLTALPCSAEEDFSAISIPNIPQLFFEVWKDAQTIRLPPGEAKVVGYSALMNGDFFGKGEGNESLVWASPVSGIYHIGLVMYDASQGVERLDVSVGNHRLGTITADKPQTGRVFFVSSQSVKLSQGEPIRIASALGSSEMTFGNVCLLGSVPKVPALVIENLAAGHRHGDSADQVMIAWTTNRPAGGKIRVGSRVFQEDRGLVNNHRVLLPVEVIGTSARLEIISTEAYKNQTARTSYVVHRDPIEHFEHHGGTLPTPPVTNIELKVAEPTAVARTRWPVSSGVPLPVGTLIDPAECRLFNAAGEEVRAQFTPLAWHPDGVHVKWLLVDFAADTTVGEQARYTLQCGVRPKRKISPAATVKTGSFGKGFAPFANVSFDGRKITEADMQQCGFEVTDGEGKVYSSARMPPEEVVVEDAGPVRTTVCVRGKMADAAGHTYTRYVCRLHFYAGRPTVRVVFSLDNDVTEPDMNLISSLKLRIPVAAPHLTFGADGKARSMKRGERLLQDEDYHFSVGDSSGRHADGWLMVPGVVAVHLRDFWQRYPKGFSSDEDGIVLELLPRLPKQQYAGASSDDLTKLYYWCDRGRYKIRTGVRLTTEFVVDFAPTADNDSYADAPLWQNPLFAACAPQWYCSSGAFGPMVPRSAGSFDVYEKNLDAAFRAFILRRDSVREFGFMNFGDWFGERKYNWGNIEYDTQWALAANFARTGNLDMLWRAEEAESHNADVDTKHYGAAVGEVWAHCTGHTGGYFPRSWKNMTLFNEGVSGTGHTWCSGHFILYGLTGERRYLETGCKIADRLAQGTTDFQYYAERNIGWPIVALMGAHGTSSNPFYINGAKLMADMAMWTQSPDTGGWGHWIDTNECRHGARCWGCKTFMTGVLLHGLKLYDLVEPRADIRQTILRNCDFVWRTCFVPKDSGFIYSECLNRRGRGNPDTFCIIGDGLAYGCRLDPAQRHRESLRQAAMGYFYESSVKDSGKPLSCATCFMPLMLYDLHALGLSRFPSIGKNKSSNE